MHFIVTSNKIRLRAIAESPHPVNGDFAQIRTSQQHAEFDWLRGVSTPCFIKSGPLCIFSITFYLVGQFQ